MKGYISTLGDFLNEDTNKIVSYLKQEFPNCEQSQIESWITLINDVKNATNISEINSDVIVAIEYALPTDGMAIDLIFAGTDKQHNKIAFIIESKQWNDNFVRKLSFSNYREEDKELHPQIQVSRHKLSFGSYLDIGEEYSVLPFVFMRNCSLSAIDWMIGLNPNNRTKDIPVFNSIENIIYQVGKTLCEPNKVSICELKNANYCPSKDMNHLF